MISRRAGMIVGLGAVVFGTLVFLASGIVYGLREYWVHMTLSFLGCAFGVLVGMMGIFAIRIEARLRALQSRLSTDPLQDRETGSSIGFALSRWPDVALVVFLALAVIAGSRGDFFKFALGLLASAITGIVYLLNSQTTSLAKQLGRFEAQLSERERRGNAGPNPE